MLSERDAKNVARLRLHFISSRPEVTVRMAPSAFRCFRAFQSAAAD